MNPQPARDASLARTLPVLAHQGGWDEILLVAVPLVVIAVLLLVANRQISAKLGAENGTKPPSPDEGPIDGWDPGQGPRDQNQA